jgi:hypothetical protein
MTPLNRFLTRQGATDVARPRTFLHLVLDESSSMDMVWDVTISSVNEFLQSQRRARIDELFVTLTKFSDARKVKTVYHNLPIADVPDLSRHSYIPSGGTALYDGVHEAMAKAEQDTGIGDRILIVVVTDGEENASREVTGPQLRRNVQERQDRGNWTFVFLAANIDALHAGQTMGFQDGNVDSYTTTRQGVQDAIQKVDAAVKQYRTADDLSTEAFYNQPKKWVRPQWAKNPGVVLTDEEE